MENNKSVKDELVERFQLEKPNLHDNYSLIISEIIRMMVIGARSHYFTFRENYNPEEDVPWRFVTKDTKERLESEGFTIKDTNFLGQIEISW
jgi:hypothetical protein